MRPSALIISVAVLGGCACTSKTRQSTTSGARGSIAGTSYSAAVVIRATNEDDGIREEYAWLAAHFPGARAAEVEKVNEEAIVFGHHTDSHDGRVFSIHTLVLPDGSIRPVYFDITAYFGKQR
jgi:hypothetical protein